MATEHLSTCIQTIFIQWTIFTQLTGKNRAYNVGYHLRKRYGNFLGETYSPNIVKAISSPFARCTDTIALALAALFPPVGKQRWRYGVEWQPINYEYNDVDDKLFLVYKHCPNFRVFQNEHANTFESLSAFAPFEDILAYIRHKTGDYKNKYVFAYSIYSTLLSEVDIGLPIPDWAETIFPDTLYEIAKTEVDQMYRGKNKILGAGYFMSKLVNDTIRMLINDIRDRERKLYIYSGHDMNIASILSWLDVLNPHLPNYCSYMAFEIHDMYGIPHIKILYQNYEGDMIKEIFIPGCGVMCPFEDFLRKYQDRLQAFLLCGSKT